MTRTAPALTSYFFSGDALRSRSVSNTVLTGKIDVPMPPVRVLADWQREITTRLCLDPGDVEQMPLARTRARWPEFEHCLQAMHAWTQSRALPGVLADSDIALMACRGARYHHDGEQYGSAAFCNVFLSEDKGLDVFFPSSGHRIALTRGTVMIFDTCQPHGVIPRHSVEFQESDFPPDQDLSQLFLTWELPIEDARVAQALGITFDVDAAGASRMNEEQVWMNGARAEVSSASGQWRRAS